MVRDNRWAVNGRSWPWEVPEGWGYLYLSPDRVSGGVVAQPGCSVGVMRVQDEERWDRQLSEFGADELSGRFRDFLVFWAETAEKLNDTHQQTPRGSLVRAFKVAEQTFGFVSVEWLGQMLLVLVEHWFAGAELWESLSVWERRLVEQATALKLAELQEMAAAGAGEGDDAP